MKKIEYFFTFFLAALVFSSCEKVIEFQPEEVTPYVVMISRPESDSLVTVSLFRSQFFLDDNRTVSYIDDATLRLRVGDATYDGTYSVVSHEGRYRFGVRPQPGDSLYIEATVPGVEGTVSAGTRMPVMPIVEVLDYVIEANEYNSAYYNHKLTFRLKGGSGREYYSISLSSCMPFLIEGSYTEEWDTLTGVNEGLYFKCQDAIFNDIDVETVFDGIEGSFSGEELTISNELFKDGEHVFTFEFDHENYGLKPADYAKMPVWLEVRSISPELYRYNQSVESQGYGSDDLFGEPVQVLCNINGGIGIFGATTLGSKRLPEAKLINKAQ